MHLMIRFNTDGTSKILHKGSKIIKSHNTRSRCESKLTSGTYSKIFYEWGRTNLRRRWRVTVWPRVITSSGCIGWDVVSARYRKYCSDVQVYGTYKLLLDYYNSLEG